jgi:hypothetical protein
MSGNLLVRFDEGRVGRIARCRPLSYSTVDYFPNFFLQSSLQKYTGCPFTIRLKLVAVET